MAQLPTRPASNPTSDTLPWHLGVGVGATFAFGVGCTVYLAASMTLTERLLLVALAPGALALGLRPRGRTAAVAIIVSVWTVAVSARAIVTADPGEPINPLAILVLLYGAVVAGALVSTVWGRRRPSSLADAVPPSIGG